MKRTRGRVVHVDSLADFDRRMKAGVTSISGWRIRSLDLTGRTAELARCGVAGASFLGCGFAPGDAARIEAAGGLVLPTPPEVPVDVDRSTLYTARELYDAPAYADTLDARAYAWSLHPARRDDAMARALHDHAIDQALSDWVKPRRLVGVMGGHTLPRDGEGYVQAARLGHGVGSSHVVATGGGPGTMEAANLGAWLSSRPGSDLDEALEMLACVPTFRPVESWASAAFAVRQRFANGTESLGIPTWHYGHEPPNVFATAIAKYFRNATREAILLEVCDAGIVFLPGSGGTVQEVFQDACENYYADESSVAPMVLVGRKYWTETLPAWPLLSTLAKGRAMENHVHLVDTIEDAASMLKTGT